MAKVLVSMDDKLLKRVDRAARSEGESRSAFLAKLAEGALARRSGAGTTPAARAALRSLDRIFANAPTGNATAAIRAARDSR